MGLFEGEGMSNWDLKVRQYVCSGVRGEGPGGSFKGCKEVTAAAILSGHGTVSEGEMFLIKVFDTSDLQTERRGIFSRDISACLACS